MVQGRLSSTVGLMADVLAGLAALGTVVAVIWLTRSQQDMRPLLLTTAAAYWVMGFLRGLKAPKLLALKSVVIALGGILPVVVVCVGGFTPKLQILLVWFVVVSLLWAAAGVRARQLTDRGESKQAVVTSLLAVLAIFVSVFFVLPTWMDARTATWINQPVQPFTITMLDGKTVSSENLKGHVVVLAFWATWCAPCQAELPQIVRIEARYRARPDVFVIALNSKTGGDTTEKARLFLERKRLSLTAAIDDPDDAHPNGRGLAGKSLGLDSLPTLYVLDRQGHLRVIYGGYDSSENLVYSLSHAINRLAKE